MPSKGDTVEIETRDSSYYSNCFLVEAVLDDGFVLKHTLFPQFVVKKPLSAQLEVKQGSYRVGKLEACILYLNRYNNILNVDESFDLSLVTYFLVNNGYLTAKHKSMLSKLGEKVAKLYFNKRLSDARQFCQVYSNILLDDPYNSKFYKHLESKIVSTEPLISNKESSCIFRMAFYALAQKSLETYEKT